MLMHAKCGSSGLKASYSVNAYLMQGEVLAWELESSHLAQRTLRVPPTLLEAPLTALAAHPDGTFFLGDDHGNVWRLQVTVSN